jgi:hypothetical protein
MRIATHGFAVISAFLAIQHHSKGAELPLENEIISALVDFRNADLTHIKNNQTAIALLRDIAAQNVTNIGTASFSGLEARVVLLRLGDEPTMRSTIQLYREKYRSRGVQVLIQQIEWADQPALIPYLAEDFSREDGVKDEFISEGYTGMLSSPRSILSGILTGRIIARSSVFSAQLKAWANEMYTLSNRDSTLYKQRLQDWSYALSPINRSGLSSSSMKPNVCCTMLVSP